MILLAALSGIFSTFGAAPHRVVDASAEQNYWKKIREREAQANGNEEQWKHEQWESSKAALPDLIREGAAIQTELIVAENGPPPPVKPSIFEGKGEYVGLGLAGLLVAILTARTLIRHRREAEIRALAGDYLADGTEAARFEMPALFASQLRPNTDAGMDFDDEFGEDQGEEDDPAKRALKAFFALAPERIVEMRKLLSVLGKAFDDAERRQVLTKLHERICELKGQANSWDLRPVWQMCSALELLLAMLLKKSKEATASTLRSVASAVDVLGELCVPGVRPDLIITPPISVLAVDDDPLCLRGVVFALQKAEMAPDVAGDGETAVARATEKYYDVVFMDIQMPGIDGLEACAQIRKTKKNGDTPVVFVTIRSDFATRAESTLKGGNDLIAKPFLMFEITVKALTYAMRKRLQLQESANRQTSGTGILPGIVTGTVSSSPVAAPAGVHPLASSAGKPKLQPAAEQTANTPNEKSASVAEDFDDDFNGDLFTEASEFLAATRTILEEANVESDKMRRQEKLGRIYLRIHSFANKAKLEQLEFAARASSALESLLKRFHQNPRTVTASTLNTVSNALSVLDHLCVRGVESKLAHCPPIRLLVVEDDPVAKRAIVGTLQLTFEKPDGANDGAEALALAEQKFYDVIFSDIEMPVMGGFGLCKRIREGDGPNRDTPIVFITSHTGFETRDQAAQSGGSDFIAKPFLPIEITVKALTFALEGRLRKINTPILDSPVTTTDGTESNLSRELLATANG